MTNINILEDKLKKSINHRRYRHSINVMETAKKLADIYNCDIKKAELSGLLHDCGRTDKDNKINIDLDVCKDKDFYKNENLKHAVIGAYLANREYNINDIDILNAIRYHTTGRENMSLLEKIVYIADKIEPDRCYEGVEQLRKLAYQNIDIALLKILNDTIEYVNRRNLYLHKDTIKARDWIVKELKDKMITFNL